MSSSNNKLREWYEAKTGALLDTFLCCTPSCATNVLDDDAPVVGSSSLYPSSTWVVSSFDDEEHHPQPPQNKQHHSPWESPRRDYDSMPYPHSCQTPFHKSPGDSSIKTLDTATTASMSTVKTYNHVELSSILQHKTQNSPKRKHKQDAYTLERTHSFCQDSEADLVVPQHRHSQSWSPRSHYQYYDATPAHLLTESPSQTQQLVPKGAVKQPKPATDLPYLTLTEGYEC